MVVRRNGDLEFEGFELSNTRRNLVKSVALTVLEEGWVWLLYQFNRTTVLRLMALIALLKIIGSSLTGN